MSGCYCTGACRKTGVCPVHGSVIHVRTDEWLPVIPPLPEPAAPPPVDGAVAVCGLCGLRITPIMGYVCSHPRCGVFPRVTCSA